MAERTQRTLQHRQTHTRHANRGVIVTLLIRSIDYYLDENVLAFAFNLHQRSHASGCV